MYTGLSATLLSITMLAGFLLAAGGLYLLINRRERKQGGLMLLAALVMFANVAIWTI